MRILEAHPAFGGITYPLGYAKATLIRVASSKGWRRRVIFPLETPESLETLERLEDPHYPSPEVAVDERANVLTMLRSLGIRQRACVYLRYVEGLDDSDIARLLDIKESTVRSQLSRAVMTLKQASVGDEEEEIRDVEAT
jgi:RNA polymerase sigma factor (sigma-70 family)